MEMSGGAHRWVRGGTGFLLGMGIVLGGLMPAPSVLSVLQGGLAYGQDSQGGGSGVAAEDPCPPVSRGAFSPCPSPKEEEKSAERGKDAGPGGEDEEDSSMLGGLGSIGGGLVITTLGFAILNNLKFLSTDCSNLSEEVDPATEKSPKEECLEENYELIAVGFLILSGGVILTVVGIGEFGEGVVDAVSHHPAPPRIRLGLIPCRECRPAPLAIGVRLRF